MTQSNLAYMQKAQRMAERLNSDSHPVDANLWKKLVNPYMALATEPDQDVQLLRVISLLAKGNGGHLGCKQKVLQCLKVELQSFFGEIVEPQPRLMVLGWVARFLTIQKMEAAGPTPRTSRNTPSTPTHSNGFKLGGKNRNVLEGLLNNPNK